jgi:hypothetical protein
MTTRTYYLPKTRISIHVINKLVERVGCSIGDIRLVQDTLRVPITCNDTDVKKIEKVLRIYNMIEE